MPNQCVTYSSCHDNLTLYDKLTDSVYSGEGYGKRREDLVSMNKLSAAIILMSRGMPFMLAGEELGRTKLGDENSYKSPVEINQIDWTALERFISLKDYYKGLIKLRKAVGVLNDETGERTELSYIDTDNKSSIAYQVSGSGYPTVIVVLNGSPDEEAGISLPKGEWVIVADGVCAGTAPLGTAEGSVSAAPRSALVLIDEKGFEKLNSSSADVPIYIRYYDTTTNEAICEQRINGEAGESYNAVIPDPVLFYYNIVGDAELSGEFEKPYKVIEVGCEPYEGGYSSVTFKFLDGADRQISDTVVMTNRVGQQYFTPYIPGIPGYSLDLKNLPTNGAGLHTEEPIEVVYRFDPESGEPSEGEYTSRANVIYMSDTGEILSRKSYMGVEGDALEIEEIAFDGYEFTSVTADEPFFSAFETNVVMNYSKKQSSPWIYVVIAGAAIALLGGVILLTGRSKRRRMNAIDIEE